MLDSAVLRKRLSFIRYLYTVGARHVDNPIPMSYMAVLIFHDCTELFLELAAEHKDVSVKSNSSFMEYWDLLSTKLGQPLSHKESMRRLNDARRSLKHSGIFPAEDALEEFKASVHDFFLTSTPLVFGCEFEQLSLVDVVSSEHARQALHEAEQALATGETRHAAMLAAQAFLQLVQDHIVSTGDYKLRAAFRSRHTVSTLNLSTDSSQVGLSLERLSESVQWITQIVLHLALGLDYRSFLRFSRLTPVDLMCKGPSGEWSSPIEASQQLSGEDCRFCIDFVIESALKLQS